MVKKKAVFFSVFSLFLVILLAILSSNLVTLKDDYAKNYLDTMDALQQRHDDHDIITSIHSIYNVSYPQISTSGDELYIHFDTLFTVDNTNTFSTDMTDFEQTLHEDYTPFSNRRFSLNNDYDTFQISPYISYYLKNMRTTDEWFLEFESTPVEIQFIVYAVDEDDLDHISTSYPAAGSTTSYNVWIYDKDGDYIDHISGFLDMDAANDPFIITLNNKINFTLGTDNPFGKSGLYAKDYGVHALFKNVNITYTYDDTKAIDVKPKDTTIASGLNTQYCFKRSDCLQTEYCIYGKCWDNVVGYWDFYDHNATHILDKTDNDNDGEIKNDIYLDDGTHLYSGVFDGVGDKIIVNDDVSLDLQVVDGMAISAWINPDSLTSSDSFSSTNPQYILAKVGDSLDEINYAFRILGGKLDFLWRNSANTGYNAKRMSSHILINDRWQHVLVTHNTTDVVFYTDGVEQSSVVSSGNILDDSTSNSGSMDIGEEGIDGDLTPQRYFNGSIDEIIIFDKALNATEVRWLYEGIRIPYNYDGSCQIDNDCTFGKTCVDNSCT